MNELEFFEKYPFWEIRGSTDGKKTRVSWSIFIPRKWWYAFGRELSEELRDACIRDGCLDSCYFTDVKEKWGELRIYMNEFYPAVDEVIKKYNLMSKTIPF